MISIIIYHINDYKKSLKNLLSEIGQEFLGHLFYLFLKNIFSVLLKKPLNSNCYFLVI